MSGIQERREMWAALDADMRHWCPKCDGNGCDCDTGVRCQACNGTGRRPEPSTATDRPTPVVTR